MGFTFEMFETDAEVFVKDLIKYSSKNCDCKVGCVRDTLLDGLRFLRPYFIISRESFDLFADIAVEESDGSFSVTYDEWKTFEDKEIPHISYCATLDQKYSGVFVQHLSISTGVLCDETNTEEKSFLETVMNKYQKRYFYKAGRQKYKVYSLRKNK